MLQAIISGQAQIREDIKAVHEEVKENTEGIEKNEKRIDKLGIQLSELSDDSPTIEEFDGFEKRVTTLE